MEINIKQAVSNFYPNPSYEQIYFEAVTNALDAGADKISIQIKLVSFDRPDTLEVEIKDNGIGFVDKNFYKFSKLLEVESKDHKGLGRLVYLAYFKEVEIESLYEGSKKRKFIFDSDFDGKCEPTSEQGDSGSSLRFGGYLKDKVYRYAFLTPKDIKENLLNNFFSLFFRKKQRGDSLQIDISLKVTIPNPDVDFVSSNVTLTLADLPDLKRTTFQALEIHLFEEFDIHYSVKREPEKEKNIYTAVCIDDRAIEYELIPIESIPKGYQLRFLFVSGYFEGKTNASRQKLELPDEITERQLKAKLREEIGHIINQEIPKVKSDVTVPEA